MALPSAETIAGWQDHAAALAWSGVTEKAFGALAAPLGGPESWKDLALFPPDIFEAAVTAARVEEKALTPLEAAQLGRLWRVARREAALSYDDPLDPRTKPAPTTPTTSSSALPSGHPTSLSGKKLKAAHYVEQGDESEFAVVDPPTMTLWHTAYERAAGGPPPEEEEATAEQVSVLSGRIKAGSPYVDFALWLPFARRISRSLKFRTWTMQPDGTFLARELAGPSNYAAWESSFNVYVTAMIMLVQWFLAGAAEYRNRIKTLAAEWPDAWGLVYQADDKGRSQGLERSRRNIDSAVADGRPAPGNVRPVEGKPWAAAFSAIARDEDYWNREVAKPAMAWLARGARGEQLTLEERTLLKRGATALEDLAPDFTDRPEGALAAPGRQKAKRKGQMERLRQRLRDTAPGDRGGDRGQGGRGKGDGKGGGKGGKGDKGGGKGPSGKGARGHTRDRSGTEICFGWNRRGWGACGQDPAPAPCPAGRAHCCEHCLSSDHRGAECPQRGYRRTARQAAKQLES